MRLRSASTAILAGLAGLVIGAATSDMGVHRYFGPAVDSYDLDDLCQLHGDLFACALVNGDTIASPACRRMRTWPTDGNIAACLGSDFLDIEEPDTTATAAAARRALP